MKQLTKSDFLSFFEAPMHLWAKKNKAIEKDSTPFDTHLAEQGYEVEKLAKQYLEVLVSRSTEYIELIWQKTYCDKNYQVKIDALLYSSKLQAYDIYEIKSSTNVKHENLADVTFQYLGLKEFLPINKLYILHLNPNYMRHGQLDIQQLFITEDVTQKTCELAAEVDIQRTAALNVIQQLSSNGIITCNKPKSCPCPKLCHPNLPDNSIYDVPRLDKSKAETLKRNNILDLRDIPNDFKLSPKQLTIVAAAKRGQPIIEREEIIKELNNLIFPLYFLDYETYNSAIPLFDGYKPQQQMIFQYSLHIIDSPDTPAQHCEFLAVEKNDPCPYLIKSLQQNIGPKGSILVWNKAFEMTCNKDMASRYPQYADFLNDVNSRIYDLADPINNGLYIHPEFKGSWSIKNVLPVMVPHLTYKSLNIQKGDMAMMAWWSLTHSNPSKPNNLTQEQQSLAQSLLEYCKMDTWAMVEIWNKFNEL